MKKILLALIFLLFSVKPGHSQAAEKNNEIKLNIANTIALASVEFGYERFLDKHQSLEAVFLFNDRINYHSEKGSRKFDTQSYKIGYNYYFGEEEAGSGLYANPFIKYRNGDFSETETISNGDTTNEINIITNMDTFMIGMGTGYKWNFNNTFVLGPFISIGRNFSEEVKERFSAIEFNAGFNIGYRF